MTRLRFRALGALALLMLPIVAACASHRGASLYASGSDALARGDVERAIFELEEAAVLVPHASEIQNHLGLAYARAGREDDALRAFERAVDLDCDNRAARHNREIARSPATGSP